MAKLTFIGGVGQVTGSCYLLETDSGRILLDCGMYQGSREADDLNEADFDFNPASIDAVVLSHAHLDHSGRLPKLVKDGFKGPVHLTRGSYHLIDLLLKDSASLQLRDCEWENKKRKRAGKPLVEPLYTMEDVDQLLSMRQQYRYHQSFDVLPDISVSFYDAGHILGSAIVSLTIKEQGSTKTLVFSGDLGNTTSPVLKDPEIIEKADILLLESTYGDRDHKPLDSTLDEFREIFAAADQDGGNVIIPSFAVGRTQDLFYWLGRLHKDGDLPQQKVYLDSPMAISASNIYEKYTDLFNNDDPGFAEIASKGWQNWLPNLNYSETTEQSMAVNRIEGGAVIIAGSGMCTGGRIRHHLKYNLWKRNAHIVFVGFQAQGTLGRLLVEGKKSIKILDSKIKVEAKIHTLGGFSAHADQSQLLQWAGSFKGKKPKLYLVHGEPAASRSLQTCFARDGWSVAVAKVKQTIMI